MTSPRPTLALEDGTVRRRLWPRLVGAPGRALLQSRRIVGRYLSVRWKLTLWYGLMCAVALGAAGFAMSYRLQQQVQASIDDSLRQTAQRMSHDLALQNNPHYQRRYTVLTRRAASSQIISLFRVYERDVQDILNQYSYRDSQPGQFEQVQLYPPPGAPSCILQSRTLQPCQPDMSRGVVVGPDAIRSVIGYGPQWVDDSHGIINSGSNLRGYLATVPVPEPLSNNGVTAILEVFQQKQNYQEIQRQLNLILTLAIPLVLLVALAAGWWIARAALRPINRISRTVRSIGESQDLSRRLNFIGPEDEVGRLAHTFDGMMDRLEKVFETQKRFVADASHELRTPLTAIRGNADLFSIAPPEEREVCIAAIRREAERMSRLVSDLLLLAAADIEEQPVHKHRTALADVLHDVHRSALILAGDKVSVELAVDEDVVIEADPDRVKQLVLNLVDNAIKFTPAGGRVTIALRTRPEEVLIGVSDTGVGIPPEEQAAIFDRFYRVEQARSTRGSGLGLSICAWIVAAHGGRIELDSEPGRGSTFTVHLPRTELQPERRARRRLIGHAVE